MIELLLLLSLWRHWGQVSSLEELIAKFGPVFYAALLLPFLPLLYSRVLSRQKQLLQNGEVAIAAVKSRYRIRGQGPYYVSYSFRDAAGTAVEGKSLDSTGMLREGSGMLVYYDGDDTDDQVAQCAAYYVVSVPGLVPDYVDQ